MLIFSSVIIASAQERVIDKSEFDAMLAGGYGHQLKWKGEKYRMTVTTSSTFEGRPQTDWASKSINEYGTSAETRGIYTSVLGGKPNPTRETLIIGNWVYTRSGSDSWTRKEYVAPGPAKEKEESNYKILSSQAEYRYLGQGKLGDRSARIYVKTERQTKFNQKSGESVETEHENRYWVDATGTIIKNQFNSETRGKSTTRTSVTMEWELDPSITFTVPEIAP